MSDPRPIPDDEDAADPTDELVAYLDGELGPKAAERMTARLNQDPRLRAEADTLQRAWDILDVLPRPEPSGNFTSRTLSQILPLSAAGSGRTAVVPAAPTMPAIPTVRSGLRFWILSATVVLLAGAAGYLVQPLVYPVATAAPQDPPLEDVPLTKNMRLYRHVDNLDYLMKLDAAELFPDEGD